MKKHMDKVDIVRNMPNKVLYVKMAQSSGIPIGYKIYNEAIAEYPEYFKEEVKHRKKYDAIPKEVHDAYHKEYWDFHEALWKDEPKSGGVFSAVKKDEEYQKYKEAFDRLRPIEKLKEKELHTKYYTPFGI